METWVLAFIGGMAVAVLMCIAFAVYSWWLRKRLRGLKELQSESRAGTGLLSVQIPKEQEVGGFGQGVAGAGGGPGGAASQDLGASGGGGRGQLPPSPEVGGPTCHGASEFGKGPPAVITSASSEDDEANISKDASLGSELTGSAPSVAFEDDGKMGQLGDLHTESAKETFAVLAQQRTAARNGITQDPLYGEVKGVSMYKPPGSGAVGITFEQSRPVVDSVDCGSIADKAGLEKGHRIISVNGSKVYTPHEAADAISQAEGEVKMVMPTEKARRMPRSDLSMTASGMSALSKTVQSPQSQPLSPPHRHTSLSNSYRPNMVAGTGAMSPSSALSSSLYTLPLAASHSPSIRFQGDNPSPTHRRHPRSLSAYVPQRPRHSVGMTAR
eukprot:Rhum_TRINITY_DN14277_c4_g1::Rhum_TRINITY_DN14277_c4_g1_i1::g.77815::m.77815